MDTISVFSAAPQFVEVTKHVASVSNVVSSRHTKRFEGDEWNLLLERRQSELLDTFVTEAAKACRVPRRAISNVEFRLGSLYVTFHVTHDEDISHEQMEQQISEYPFREVWRLYQQRNEPASGLDLALEQIRALEEAGAAKDEQIQKLEKELAEKAKELNELRAKTDAEIQRLQDKAKDTERDLLNSLSQAQNMLREAEEKIKALEADKKKAIEAVERERKRLKNQAERHTDLIAVIMQENKEEMKAKEREYSEVIEELEMTIDKLRRRSMAAMELSGQFGYSEEPLSARRMSAQRGPSMDSERNEEFSKLMGRMEEMAALLEKSRQTEAEARSEIGRLTEALKISEEARQAESVMYENNCLMLQQQLAAYRESKLAEDHQARTEGNRTRGVRDVSKAQQENQLIVKQYEASLDKIIATFQDRLGIVNEEFLSYIRMSEEDTVSEKHVLADQEAEAKGIRKTFRETSKALQQLFWKWREADVVGLCESLDSAAADMEKSRAAIMVAVALLDSRKQMFVEQKEWMSSHQKALGDLVASLHDLSRRAFERQLTLMNKSVAAVNGNN